MLIFYMQQNNKNVCVLLTTISGKRQFGIRARHDGKSINFISEFISPYEMYHVVIENTKNTNQTLESISFDKIGFKLTGKPFQYQHIVKLEFDCLNNSVRNINKNHFFDKTKVDII